MRMWERSVSFWMAAYASSSPCASEGRSSSRERMRNSSRSSPLCCGRLSSGTSWRLSSHRKLRHSSRKAVSSNREPKMGKSSRCGSSVCRKLSSWLAREGGCVNEKRLRQADREISVIPIWPLPRFSILCCRIRRSASGTRMIVSDGKVSVCVISSPFALYYTGNAGKSHGRTTGSIPATLLLA